ncbi:MAG TPA: diguanylate cyclase [Candidatus Solibacter sp.]|nr:diguanylate cyclase [Candidatus Solibacter sp.]
MVIQESTVSLALFMAAAFTGLFFAFLYGLKRQSYQLWWASAWGALALCTLPRAADYWFGRGTWEAPVSTCMLGGAALLFGLGAQRYAGVPLGKTEAGISAVILVAWAGVVYLKWLSVSPELVCGVMFLFVSLTFWKEGRKQQSYPDLFLTGAFFVWGAVLAVGAIWQGLAEWLDTEVRLLFVVPELLIGALMVMAVYEEEKRRVERNMLALSNLNLATSGFVGGEIQRMLAQALDRVLSVARIQMGALFLHHGDPLGPRSVIAAGLSDTFCASIQEEKLDDYQVQLVRRLGGLVVLRDLTRSSSWAPLEREENFKRFRELALAEGIRTLAGISLQAKEKVFGLLLLGGTDNRSFTPAELRLLLALGHQIGMAVENSYLIQQTARRTEELHTLNEIGRVFSSTLDLEELFNHIFTEMQRLFDVSNFFITIHEPKAAQIRYEVEILDSKRLPRRTRPMGKHLSEYIVETRQPLLIRERLDDELKRLGLEGLLPQMKCFCAVPLILYNRAIGVLGVHSPQERAFDEGHLELLRVLASEAGIAMENARLFEEERKKTRHLLLLNNVSRHAITTLDPDELLAKMTAEMESALAYDHMGIAMLDYATKEVVVHAEGGRRQGGKGKRIPFDNGLLGHVARSGQMISVHDVTSSGIPAVLPDSVSAIGFPLIYADQLLGVLYVETSTAWDFTEDEITLLQTLTDQISGALHNALTFQRAQEQAITDGLTGVKTHRFFMEALSVEWKRSTRAGRPFSLVLMDLDRFKFVNDFYGHLEGDVVLQRVGKILEQSCRRSDVVARYGGDEFVVLMPETNVDQARQLGGKLRSSVASDPMLREKNISASFGIAAFPLHGSTPQELIQVADASMYVSKHQGGNAVSTADHYDTDEARKWKRDVLEAYLGVELKRQFTTGPQAFEEILRRLQHFVQSLTGNLMGGADNGEEIGGSPAPLTSAVIETLTQLSIAIDAKDPYTQGHSQKVSAYGVMLAQSVGLTPHEIEEIRLAGLLHDVGKVGIPEAILNKPGPLDTDEWEVMKTHATLGAQLLDPLCDVPGSAGDAQTVAGVRKMAGRLREMVLHHHEFYDGSGYPAGLTGAEIPLGARIIGLVDSYDTITSDRMYKRGRTTREAMAELERCGAAQFDPELVKTFLEVLRRLPQPQVSTRER